MAKKKATAVPAAPETTPLIVEEGMVERLGRLIGELGQERATSLNEQEYFMVNPRVLRETRSVLVALENALTENKA